MAAEKKRKHRIRHQPRKSGITQDLERMDQARPKNNSRVDAADARHLRLSQAWELIVKQGLSVQAAARAVGIPYSTMRYHAKRKGWLPARTEYEALQADATNATDVVARATALKRVLLRHVTACKERLELMERALHRKWITALTNTQEIDVTDYEGNQRRIRVATVTASEMNALLNVQGNFIRQLKDLAQLSDARLARDLRRLMRTQRRLDHKTSKRALELATQAPALLLDEEDPPGGQ